jgi:hypothetical protein
MWIMYSPCSYDAAYYGSLHLWLDCRKEDSNSLKRGRMCRLDAEKCELSALIDVSMKENLLLMKEGKITMHRNSDAKLQCLFGVPPLHNSALERSGLQFKFTEQGNKCSADSEYFVELVDYQTGPQTSV